MRRSWAAWWSRFSLRFQANTWGDLGSDCAWKPVEKVNMKPGEFDMLDKLTLVKTWQLCCSNLVKSSFPRLLALSVSLGLTCRLKSQKGIREDFKPILHCATILQFVLCIIRMYIHQTYIHVHIQWYIYIYYIYILYMNWYSIDIVASSSELASRWCQRNASSLLYIPFRCLSHEKEETDSAGVAKVLSLQRLWPLEVEGFFFRDPHTVNHTEFEF